MSTYVIAEIGINHQGSLEVAKRLIDAACFAGADAVKFQKRTPELCVPDEQKGKRKITPWGEMTYLDYKRRMEFGQDAYEAIDRYCAERGIDWFASVWDEPSVEFMAKYGPLHIKVPSAMLTDYHLVREASSHGHHVILSTGMSTLDEIDTAESIVRQNARAYTLMHCHSAYPAPTEELNLRCIQTLRERYLCDVGYSGHQWGVAPTVWAVVLGATMVEMHITLDRTSWGSDQMSSVEAIGFARMVQHIRSVERALGDGVKHVWESEQEARARLRPVVEAMVASAEDDGWQR